MIKTSEFVTIGHPDKIADYISCYLLDRYLQKDKNVRYAVQVQIKDNYVTIGGQITSTANFTKEQIIKFVKEAINDIGYTKEYQNFWAKENTICGDDVEVAIHISQQSADIANGVNNNGWGDQGIFWGMATNNVQTNYMPSDLFFARKIAYDLFENQIGGLDIKTQVSIKDDLIDEIVVAIPMINNNIETVKQIVKNTAYIDDSKIYINGTGIYKKHGSIADCGTTGRKLAVDLYGGNCRIGGGSIWTKDGTKADLTLNVYARFLAKKFIQESSNNLFKQIHCAISCRIGSSEIIVSFYDQNMNELKIYKENTNPKQLIEKFQLNTPIFTTLCKKGIFYNI